MDESNYSSLPEVPDPLPEVTGQQAIIIISPDGNVIVYDPEGTITAETYDNAYSLWSETNGALDKPFRYYSVTEALLTFIAIGSIVTLLYKVFKRRKL